MPLIIESFPHGGEHCANDLHQSHVVLWLLGVFAVAIAIAMIVGIRAL